MVIRSCDSRMSPYTFIFANNLIAVTKHTFRRNLQNFDLRSEINLCRFHFAKLFRSSNGYNRHSKKCRTEENTFMTYNIQAVSHTEPDKCKHFPLTDNIIVHYISFTCHFFLTILQTPASPADSFGQRCHMPYASFEHFKPKVSLCTAGESHCHMAGQYSTTSKVRSISPK